MNFCPPVNTCRTMALSLIAIVGLSSAFLPEQALARKPKGKPGSAHASVKAKAKTKANTRQSTRPEKAEVHNICADSFNGAKERTQSGHLLEARELSGKCARKSCGDFLHHECTTLYTQLEADIPSVVPVVTDAAGAPVEVKMDGQALTSKLDGHAIPIDPGDHEFTFNAQDGVSVTRKVLIVQGRRNRPIAVTLHPANKETAEAARVVAEKPSEPEGTGLDAAESEEAGEPRAAEPRVTALQPTARESRRGGRSEGGASWLAYALGGVGVVSLGSAGLFTYWGRQDNSALMGSCGTDCKPESVHHIRMVYLAADISIGVGVVALAASTWLFVSSHGTDEKASTRGAHLTLFDVQPTPSGALATLGGTF